MLCVLDSLAPGGTEQSTVLGVPRLRALGVDARIVTLRGAEHDLTERARSHGVPVEQLSSGSLLGRIRELRRIVAAGDVDLVHTALYRADQIGRIAAWGTGVPVVSSLVSTPYVDARLADPSVKRWKLRLAQALDATTGRLMTEHFHAVSDGTATANTRALRLRPERVTVAERGRDAGALGRWTGERRAAQRAALDIPDDAVVLLSLGRLDHMKGHTVLLESISQLDATRDLVVLIAGKDGAASSEVREAIARDQTLASRVRLLGHRTDVAELLCAADMLVISSLLEGTAGVAVEAMALDVPVVSTDLEGLTGVLEHDRNALLVERSNPEALSAAILYLIDHPDVADRLARAGRSDFVSRFTLDAAARRLRDLYESVLDD